LIRHHNRKVLFSLLAYTIAIITAASSQSLLPTETWKQAYEEKYTEFILDQKLTREPDKALWLGIAGDLMQHKKIGEKSQLQPTTRPLPLNHQTPSCSTISPGCS